MRGALDPFGNETIFICESCSHQRRADRWLKAGRDDLAKKALVDAEKTAGRWFECRVNGEGQDMSEKQIELARASGHLVEVITEVV